MLVGACIDEMAIVPGVGYGDRGLVGYLQCAWRKGCGVNSKLCVHENNQLETGKLVCRSCGAERDARQHDAPWVLRPQFFVTLAPGREGDRSRVLDAFARLGDARAASLRLSGTVVRRGSLERGDEWLRVYGDTYPIVAR